MDVKTIQADALFRVYTACPDDSKTLVLDVRPNKDFKKLHLMQAYNIRLASNKRVLLVSVVLFKEGDLVLHSLCCFKQCFLWCRTTLKPTMIWGGRQIAGEPHSAFSACDYPCTTS